MILVAVFIFLSLLSVIRPKSNKVFVCLVILTWFVAAFVHSMQTMLPTTPDI